MKDYKNNKSIINSFLLNYIGIDPDQISLMEDYVKDDLLEEYEHEFDEYHKETIN